MRQVLEDNVYVVRGSAPEQGVTLVTPRTGGHAIFKIGTGQRALVVPFGTDGARPDTPGKVLRSAEPGIKGHMTKCLVRRLDWIGIIVQVTAWTLDFTDLAEPIEGIVFWAGGEGEEPFLRYGPRNSPYERDEVFVLAEGEWILVCDNERRIMYLGCKNGRPVWRAASTEEIVDRVHHYGMHVEQHWGMFWAHEILLKLDASAHATAVQARVPSQVTDSDRNKFRRTGG